jgi:demethylmenaquinone methyltransferase/2-methoxy-6-polyprenyl-1,4-benzoquinol methylase
MSQSSESRSSGEPHPVLKQYYADHTGRRAFVRGLFDTTASHYDRVNRLLSWGSGGWYRRHALLRAGLRPGMSLLDVATGTGLLARQAIRVMGSADRILGLDLSAGMLLEAKRALGIQLVQARAEQMPITGASFDFLTMGYALRHVSDLDTTFREFHRVLRPGGSLLLIEIGRPSTRLRCALLRIYLGRVVPLLAHWATGVREMQTLMRYYWETVEQCVSADAIVQALARADFVDARYDTELGMFRTFYARKR